jgi:hypothetical protein
MSHLRVHDLRVEDWEVRFLALAIVLALSCSPAWALDRCTLPGEQEFTTETDTTPEMNAIVADMDVELRTAYGRDGLPGNPTGPMYEVINGVALMTDATKVHWNGPKRAVVIYANSNGGQTFNALVQILVTGLYGVPKIQPDFALYNLYRSKTGVKTAPDNWSDPTGDAWMNTFQTMKARKLGPTNPEPWVTTYPEIKLAILGWVGAPGNHMTSAEMMFATDLVHGITPGAIKSLWSMAFMGWSSGQLYTEAAAHSDDLLMRAAVINRVEGYPLDHQAIHSRPRDCRAHYKTDRVHPSEPVGAMAIALERAQRMYEDSKFAFLWRPVIQVP